MANPSLLPRTSPLHAIVSGGVLRARLCRARDELHDLEGKVPPGYAADLSGVLDAIEQTLIARWGWQYPEPLTAHDEAVLRAAGCPA